MISSDYFQILGSLGLGSRLKRVSDLLRQEVRHLYRTYDIDFDPKWFPLFSLLHGEAKKENSEKTKEEDSQRNSLTVTEAAERLRYTHPFINQISKEMDKKGLLSFQRNKSDGRSRYLQLTKQGREVASQLKPIWDDIKTSLDRLITEKARNLLLELDLLEASLKEMNLVQRVNMIKKQNIGMKVELIEYRDEYRPDFERLNREFLDKYFTVEEIDLYYFKDPVKTIIDSGGNIFFARFEGEIVGTCAMVKEGDRFELAKMGVTERFQGLGIGKMLIENAFKWSLERGVSEVFLVTNTVLSAALHLYRKIGFKEVHHGEHPKYSRANLIMEISLDSYKLVGQSSEIAH